MNRLRVNADEVFNTSHATGNDAEELREELAVLQREWDNLSREWSGAASSAYSAIWEQWLEGATALIDALADSSQKLGVAAVSYIEGDEGSAEVIGDSTIDLGL